MKRRGFLGWMFGAPAAVVAGKAAADVLEKFPEVVPEPVESEPVAQWAGYDDADEDMMCSAYVQVDFDQMKRALDHARTKLPLFVKK